MFDSSDELLLQVEIGAFVPAAFRRQCREPYFDIEVLLNAAPSDPIRTETRRFELVDSELPLGAIEEAEYVMDRVAARDYGTRPGDRWRRSQ